MKGLELAKAYYETCAKAQLEKEFADVYPHLAIGLTGSGSECLGYDDGISADHDFEPGFCIFLPAEDVVDPKTEFRMMRAYTHLPDEFMGIKRNRISPVGGSRHGVLRRDDFFIAKCGKKDGDLTQEQWLRLPEQSLLEAVNGEVFYDGDGEFTKIRERLSYFPEDVRLKKLAGYLLLMGQAGQYNYPRLLQRNETGAAQLAVHAFTDAAMHVIFLLNRQYMPYYKWSFRAMKDLKRLSNLSESLEFLISSGNETDKRNLKTEMIEDIAALVARALKEEKLSDADCTDMEKHAYAVNDHITDGMLRNLHILSGV